MNQEVQRQEREREKITVADTEEYGPDSEMTERGEICRAATAVPPAAENPEREPQADVKQICSHRLDSLSSE